MPTWLPDSGLLREHHDYGIWATDAPPIYHVASMLTAMASVCADNALLIIKDKPYPLHIWTMLVGRSTQDRKTTSGQLAISRVESKVEGRVKQVYGSPEGLLQDLATNVKSACATLYIPEGQSFFEQQSAGYWRHARGMFMELYDYRKKPFERKLVREVVRLNNPRVSILAACARPILEHHTREADWLGGFLARFLMISGDPLPLLLSPRSSATSEARIEQLIMNIMRTGWGNLGCTSGALRIFEDFTREIHVDMDSFPPGIHPSLGRLPEMAKRFAGLYEISAQATNPPPKGTVTLVTPQSAEHAVALCRASREDALVSLSELATAPGHSRDVARVAIKIRRAGIGGLTRSEIGRAQRDIRSRDLDDILRRLLDEYEVQMSIRRSTGAGRPSTIYVHNQSTADAKKLAAQMARTPKAGGAWVPLDPSLGTVDISSLPAFDGPDPGVAYDPDEPDGSDGSGWN
jgi:hypothetical protein